MENAGGRANSDLNTLRVDVEILEFAMKNCGFKLS